MRGPARPAGRRRPGPSAGGAKGGLCEALAADAAAEVARLAAAGAASLAGGAGLEAAELAIRTAVMELGLSVLEPLLAADGGYRGPRADCGAGRQARFVSYRDKTVDTVPGPVRMRRAWYHCAQCEHGLAPRDGEPGVAGQTMSPGPARMSDRAAAAVPFTPGAALVGELAGITLTGRRLGRRAEADGAAAAAVIEAQAAAIAARTLIPLPPADLPDMLYTAIDGTGVPVAAAETEGRDGKAGDGKAHTREVKLCCCFTQTTVDEDGRPVRDPHSSSYLATFAPAAGFGTLMAAEARRRGAACVRQLVILGDGAPWIWNLASQHSPQATAIADLYHARQHLHDPGKLLAFMLGDHHAGWVAERLDDVDNGDIAAAARVFPLTGIKAKELQTALGYFENNAHRMRYKHFRSPGMFAGSGTVEAGCRAVVGQRLKLSGMHWPVPGAAGILPPLPGSQRSLGRILDPARPSGHQRPEPIWQHFAQPDHQGQARLPASHLHSCPTPPAGQCRTRPLACGHDR